MIIFLKNIPPETKKYEIASFINEVINDCYLDNVKTTVSIENIETFTIQEVESNAFDKYGLVKIYPKEVGKRVIKKLNGTIFKQNHIVVREYVNRSASNDRRNVSQGTIDFNEQRTLDRRREPIMNSWQKYPILVHSVHSI